MKNLLMAFVFFVLTTYSLFSQKEDYNWYFGNNCAMSFDTQDTSPKLLTPSKINTSEGCSSISDGQGRLLFYTDGRTVYTKNHTIMTNGTGLKGESSATQSAIIVPKPGSKILYYIFTVNSVEYAPINFNYSIVDMTKKSGLGEVITKNILLENDVAEKITAIKHANGINFWILIHKTYSDEFEAFLLTSDSLKMNPVISHAGKYQDDYMQAGYLKSSPLGNKILQAVFGYYYGYFELFDFDPLTGSVSNQVLMDNYEGAYGVEFSPDGKKIYCGQATPGNYIFQFDISSNNSQQILGSVKKLSLGSTLEIGALQLAPNNKIYFAEYNSKYLGFINFPNEKGDACKLSPVGVKLNNTVYYGLPNMFKNTTQFSLPELEFKLPDLCTNGTDSAAIDLPGNEDYDYNIDSIYTTNRNLIKIFNKDSLLGTYQIGQTKKIKIAFKAVQTGKISDTIFVHINKPADYLLSIPITGNVSNGDLIISTKDTIAQPGASYCIPIFAKYSCTDSVRINYHLTVKVLKHIFVPASVKSGKIDSIVEEGAYYLVFITDSNLLINPGDNEINDLCGKLYLGENKNTTIDLANFTADGFNSGTQNGNITLYYCQQDLRGIILQDPTVLTVTPNPASISLNVGIRTSDEGNISLQLVSSIGTTVWRHDFEKNDSETLTNNQIINLSDFPNGIYYLRLISPWNVQVQKVIINK